MRSIRPVESVFFRYGWFVQLLHWLTVICVIGVSYTGYASASAEGDEKSALLNSHISYGAAMLFLTLFRIFVRMFAYTPPLPLGGDKAHLLRAAAKLSQAFLYLCLLLLPVSGWLMMSAADAPPLMFGMYQLPHITKPDAEMFGFFFGAHKILMVCFLAAIALHISAVIFHMTVVKDRLLFRMLPGRMREM